MTWPISADPGDFPAALAWLQQKSSIPAADFAALSKRSQQKAFTVAGVAELDVVDHVLVALDAAVKDGDDLDDFKSAIGDSLLAAWQGTVDDPAWRLETIFRTNLQGAYSAGRFEAATDDDTLRDRPYWRFDAIDDGRESAICRKCGVPPTILPADHPWWLTHYPLLHHSCRSAVASLTAEEAHAEGITKSPTDLKADKGFGGVPTEDDWKPDLSKYDDELDAPALAEGPVHGPPKPEHDPAYWQLEYAAKYGDAASTVGWGRAAHERGLDMPFAEVRAKATGLIVPEHDAWALAHVTDKGETARELVGKYGFLQDSAVNIASVFAGHVDRIVPHPTLNVAATLPKGKADAALALTNLDGAKAWMGRLIDSSVKHDVTIKWVKKRGSCSGNAITASYREGVIVHEWGHALEHLNPKLQARALAFLEARCKGEPEQRMSVLTKNQAYGPAEVGRGDAFINKYMGKSYRYGGKLVASEITSMGADYAFSLGLSELWRDDPELLYFLLGQLAGA